VTSSAHSSAGGGLANRQALAKLLACRVPEGVDYYSRN